MKAFFFFFLIQNTDTFLKCKSFEEEKKKIPIAIIILSICNPKKNKREIEMQVNFYKIPLDVTVGGVSDYYSSFEFSILKQIQAFRRLARIIQRAFIHLLSFL